MKPGTIILPLCTIVVMGLAACNKNDTASSEKGPAERAGQQFDQAAAKAGEELNKAAQKAGQGLQQAGRELQEKAAEAQKNNDNKQQ